MSQNAAMIAMWGIGAYALVKVIQQSQKEYYANCQCEKCGEKCETSSFALALVWPIAMPYIWWRNKQCVNVKETPTHTK